MSKDAEIWDDIVAVYPRLEALDKPIEEIIYAFVIRWMLKRNG